MSIDETIPRAMQEGPSSPKKHEAQAWFTSLKPSHAEAFLWDSSIVKEAQSHLFSKHSYNFIHDGTCNLSDDFKGLAKVLVCWEKLSTKYNFHGLDQRN